MKMILFIKVLFLYFFLSSNLIAEKFDYFEKGKSYFEKNKFERSKFFFEKSIVFNPKDENSYLYLAKIFNNSEDDIQEEMNLQSVLLLNPKNDEAIYMLINLKIKQSDYDETKRLIDEFKQVCNSFCSKTNEIEDKFDKLEPSNDQNNN